MSILIQPAAGAALSSSVMQAAAGAAGAASCTASGAAGVPELVPAAMPVAPAEPIEEVLSYEFSFASAASSIFKCKVLYRDGTTGMAYLTDTDRNKYSAPNRENLCLRKGYDVIREVNGNHKRKELIREQYKKAYKRILQEVSYCLNRTQTVDFTKILVASTMVDLFGEFAEEHRITAAAYSMHQFEDYMNEELRRHKWDFRIEVDDKEQIRVRFTASL